jgi:Spy/CpxP family protein refolding chaperone
MLPDFFLAALTAIELKPEQTAAVQAIQQDLHKVREVPRAAHERLVEDLADGVSSNKLDESKIGMDIGALREAVVATAPALQEAMNRLHKVLDVEQRKKVVAAVRERAKAARQGEATGMGSGLRAEYVKTLAEDLAVSPEQQKSLDKKLDAQFKTQASAIKEKLSALGTQLNLLSDSFLSDKFDPKTSGVGAYGPDLIVVLAKHRLEFVKTLMSVLKPEQCKVLAKKIRARIGAPDADADVFT